MTLTHLTPKDEGWVIPMTREMARAARVAEGSYVVLYLKEGSITAEILPPATEEMKESVRRFAERNADFLEEMKRLGD
ncbi:MAG: hypothetical protein H0W76_29745 [Pyrinomonadaceae bacterium]|nr:hypothetical protein [Pyrinomonadaceae bacterium]